MATEIKINKGGPTIISTTVKGEVMYITDLDGITKSCSTLALCSCGKSANGVRCDGSHKVKEVKTEENETTS